MAVETKDKWTSAFTVYSEGISCVEVGLSGCFPYLKFRAAREDEVQDGEDFYEKDGIIFRLGREEATILRLILPDLIEGKIESYQFTREFEDSQKNLTFGIGLDGESEMFQMLATIADPDGSNETNIWFDFNPVTIDDNTVLDVTYEMLYEFFNDYRLTLNKVIYHGKTIDHNGQTRVNAGNSRATPANRNSGNQGQSRGRNNGSQRNNSRGNSRSDNGSGNNSNGGGRGSFGNKKPRHKPTDID